MKIKEITNNYCKLIGECESEIYSISKKKRNLEDSYKKEILTILKERLSINPYYKTRDGFIKIDNIDDVNVESFFRVSPQITVKGFYIRGVRDTDGEKYYSPYGYYDNNAGFLLSDLEPINEESFLQHVQTVTEQIIKNLSYKPNQYYREENDRLDIIISAARKTNIDIDYYPEIKVSLIKLD